MNFCGKCGFKLEDKVKYCPSCGNSIELLQEENNLDKEKSESIEDNKDIINYEEELKEDKTINDRYESSKEDESINDIDESSEKNKNIDNKEETLEDTRVINKESLLQQDENISNKETILKETTLAQKKKLSLKTKIAIISCSIIIILFSTIYFIGKSVYKPSKVISEFEQTIKNNDKNKLSKLLYCKDSRLEFDETNAGVLMDYVNENSSIFNTELDGLRDQLYAVESKIGGNKNNTELFSLECVGKKFFVFSEYKIAVKPAFIEVKTTLKDVKFSLNNVEIGQSTEDNYKKEFGPFIPGKYKLSAQYDGKYTTLSSDYDINFIKNINNFKATIEVFENLKYVNITSEYPEADIFVDGKETGIKVKDAKKFGPLNEDSIIYATFKQNDKVIKSNEVTVNNSERNIDLSFKQAELKTNNVKQEVKNSFQFYLRGFQNAVNTGRLEYVEDYIYPGSALYEEHKKYVPNTYEKKIKEYVQSCNITSIQLDSDEKSGVITTEEVYKVEKEGIDKIENFKYKYKFKYNDLKKIYQFESIEENK